MRLASNGKKFCITIVTLLLLNSCATFHEKKLPQISAFQPLKDGMVKSNIGYSFAAGSDSMKGWFIDEIQWAFRQEFIDVFNESGYFESISLGNQGDIIIQAQLINSEDIPPSIAPVITGLSLWIIPMWMTEKYNVTAEVTSADGKKHIYKLTDSSKTYLWLPLIVIAPFNIATNVPKQVRKNIWKNLIIKMQEDGILSR